MRERPILFSAPMVRAILDGTKTQTRRVVKPQPRFAWIETGRGPASFEVGTSNDDAHCVCYDDFLLGCPYGQPGDRLWVKERIDHIGDGVSVYAADFMQTVADAWPWKRNSLSSIHCPRGLSRITLEVVSVRVERLHDITAAGVMDEGVDIPPVGWSVARYPGQLEDERGEFARSQFCGLWESINGAGSWNENPWVWVVEFKRVQP